MRFVYGSVIAVALALCTSSLGAQAPAGQDGSVAIKDGGIFAKGWQGKIDAQEEKAGQVLNNARLTEKGGVLSVRTGPAVTYWNPANRASGNYTVKATFTESNYMGLNDHPHPYGIVIGGNDLGTENASYLYCAAYGNGSFIFRGFGPAPFQLGGRTPIKDDAVAKAAGVGQPVTQSIAVTVKGDSISCSINNKTVATHPRSAVVGAGKLKSTDGHYGLRFGHNTDATVTDFKKTKAQ